MAARHTEYRIYPMSVQSIMDELHTPRFLSTLGIHWKFDNIGALQFTYHHNASFTSWGEDITVRLSPVSPDQTRVDVDSVCSMPTQIVDWGSNKENVYKVFRHLEMYVPQNPQNGGGYPGNPNGQYGYPAPGANLSRCPFCGADLFPNSIFCPQCGSKI